MLHMLESNSMQTKILDLQVLRTASHPSTLLQTVFGITGLLLAEHEILYNGMHFFNLVTINIALMVYHYSLCSKHQ
jgi:hypothetical protein